MFMNNSELEDQAILRRCRIKVKPPRLIKTLKPRRERVSGTAVMKSVLLPLIVQLVNTWKPNTGLEMVVKQNSPALVVPGLIPLGVGASKPVKLGCS
jgi:hypothetical protein